MSSAKPRKLHRKLFVIGDSISLHYGPYLEQMLGGYFSYARKNGEESALRDLDLAQGANGGDSSMVLAYLTAMQRSGGLSADVVLLNCGLHDIKTDLITKHRQVSPEDYRRHLEEIVPLVTSRGATLIWIRTTPCDEAVHNTANAKFHRFATDGVAYNEIADRIMSTAGIPSIDLYEFTKALGPNPYCDHVHFTPAIRQAQAAFIAGWLIAWARPNTPVLPV